MSEISVSDQGTRSTPVSGVPRLTASKQFVRLSIALVLTDMLAFVVGRLAAFHLVIGLGEADAWFVTLTVLTPLMVLALFSGFRLYNSAHVSASDEFRRLILAISVANLILVAAAGLHWGTENHGWPLVAWLFTMVLVLVARRGWHWQIGRARARGNLTFRTAVVGGNEEAVRIGRTLRSRPLGYDTVGMIVTGDPPADSDLPVLGTLAELADVIRAHRVECLFVASSSLREWEVRRVTEAARMSGSEVRVSANLPETLSSRVSPMLVGDLTALSLQPVRLEGVQSAMKRGMDVVVASLGLVVSSPLLLAIAAAVKIQDRGPVLFRQIRTTKGGQTFTMMKFRTMVKNPGANGTYVVDGNGQALSSTDAYFKLKRDPRVTPLGRWLRRWSLDEVPQLWNVLKGDMSLVGPRPLPVEQVQANPQLLSGRHAVSAGLTGWWQIQGRSDLSADESVRLDLFYIENWSLSLDLYILLKTVGATLRRKGAV